MNEERGEWSVVVTGYTGTEEAQRSALQRISDFAELLPATDIGPHELALLVLESEEDLPAEVAEGMTLPAAETVADSLRAVEVAAEVRRTDALGFVRHRVSELQPDFGREDIELTLSRFGNLVLNAPPVWAARSVRRARQSDPEVADWRIEDYMNHVHFPCSSESEETLAEMARYVDALVQSLQTAYPERLFTISREDDTISFWQTTPDSPREPEEGQELTFIGPDQCHPC